MKKLFIALFAFIALGVNAQIPQQGDTLRIITSDNVRHDYLFDFVKSLELYDNSKVTVNFYDNTSDRYSWKDVKSLRFYNRWSDPDALLKAQSTGAYEGLFSSTVQPFGLLYMVSCLASDEMLGGGGLQDHYFHGLDLLDPTAYPRDEVWKNYYKAIANVNNAIAQLQFMPAEVKSSDINHALGEALFMRAYYYTQLASIFGPVPLVLNNTWEEKMSSSTAEETWGQIMLDLKNAISLMNGYSPTLTSDDSRVGKYAAEALLARSFLFYMGFYRGVHDISAKNPGITLPDGTSLTKKKVVTYINDCVNNSGFSLVEDYRNLWPYTNRLTVEDYGYTQGQGLEWVEDDGAVNPEVLFKVKYNTLASWSTSVGYANQVAVYMGIRGYQALGNTFPIGQGWGAGPVSSAFYSDWAQEEPNDMRRNASIENVDNLYAYTMGAWKDGVQETKYHEKKNSPISCMNSDSYNGYSETFETLMFGAGLENSVQLGNIHPLNIIRFADVLLMQSELTGTVDGINSVRARAGLPALSTYSLAALQNERRWELAFEGVRWNDMCRWGDDYCKAALDKQMDIDVYHLGSWTANPQGILEYDNNPIPYSQRYAVNHGFFSLPTTQTMEGGAAISAMQGEWTYQDEELMLDYIVIDNDMVIRYDGDNHQVAEGTLSATKTNDFDNRICAVTFTNGSMLPVSKKGTDNDGTLQYNLTSLDENTMTLTSSKGTLTLRRTGYEEQMLREVSGIQWTYAVYNSYDYDIGADVTVGSYGLCSSWDSELTTSGSLPISYMPHIESVTDQDLTAYLSSKGVNVTNGEADPFAYMTLSMKDKKIRKYKSDGSLISEKAFSAKLENDYIVITTEPNATLIPYLYNKTNQKEVSFIVRSHPRQARFANRWDEPGLELISVTKVNGAQTYWMFGRRGLTDEELESKLTVTQQNMDGVVTSNGRILKVTLDLPYDCSYFLTCEFEDGTIVPGGPEGGFRIKGRLGETFTKKLRFRFKNCNQTEAVTERTFTIYIDRLDRFWIYGEDPSSQPPFQPGAWDAAAMRFSDYEGKYLPTLPDEIYFGLKTLIFDVSDVSEDFDLKVMNGWWSNTYYDHVKWHDGQNELQITETMANECAKGGQGYDLDLLLYSGTMTLNAVYYEE